MHMSRNKESIGKYIPTLEEPLQRQFAWDRGLHLHPGG